MRRLTLLSTVLLMLAAPRVTRAQDVVKWSLGGANPSGYVMTADGSPMTVSGATLSLHSTSAPASGYGSLSSSMRVDTLAGRRVRILADVETRDISTSASIWLRVDSAGRMLVLDNGADQGIRGTTTGPTHLELTLYVPPSATTLVFGLLLSGTGEASARHAAGSETTADTYPAIRLLLGRLGDHHSFLMKPQGASAFVTGGAENPRPLVRVQRDGVGYIAVPAYGGSADGSRDRMARVPALRLKSGRRPVYRFSRATGWSCKFIARSNSPNRGLLRSGSSNGDPSPPTMIAKSSPPPVSMKAASALSASPSPR